MKQNKTNKKGKYLKANDHRLTIAVQRPGVHQCLPICWHSPFLGGTGCHSTVPSLDGQQGCGEADTAACPLWGAQGHQCVPPRAPSDHHSSQPPLHTWCQERCGAVFWFRRIIFDPILRLWVSKWALKAFMSQQCCGQSRPNNPTGEQGVWGWAQSRCFSFDPLKTRKVSCSFCYLGTLPLCGASTNTLSHSWPHLLTPHGCRCTFSLLLLRGCFALFGF